MLFINIMTSLSDLSFGALMIFNEDVKGKNWKTQIQTLLARGNYKCSSNMGIKIKGISAETLFFNNNVDISNTLTVNSIDISKNLTVHGLTTFKGTVTDLSGNKYTTIPELKDLSLNYYLLDTSVNDISLTYPHTNVSDKVIIITSESSSKKSVSIDSSYIDISAAINSGLLEYIRDLSNNFLRTNNTFSETASSSSPPTWWNNYNDLSYSDFEVWAAEKVANPGNYYGGVGGFSNYYSTGDISNIRHADAAANRAYVVNPWVSPLVDVTTSNNSSLRKVFKKYYMGIGVDPSSPLDISNATTHSVEDISNAINNIKSIVTDLYQPPTMPPPPIVEDSDGTTRFDKPWVMPLNYPPSSYLQRPKHIAKLLSKANFGKRYCDENEAICYKYPINSDASAAETRPLDITGQNRFPLKTDPSNVIIVIWGLDYYNEIAWAYPLLYGLSDASLDEFYPTVPLGDDWNNHPELKFSVNASFNDSVKPGNNDMNVWVVFQASNPIQNTGSYSLVNSWKAGSQGRYITTVKEYRLESKESGTWTKKIPNYSTYDYGI